jgi:hypothetical protein
MLKRLGYEKDKQYYANFKRNCGLWLLFVGTTIVVATLTGGTFLVNPFIFIAGYAIGFYIANINATVRKKFAVGSGNVFQIKLGNISVIILFILMFGIAGPFFPSMNWRMIWLGAFLATGLHFLPFYYVHGKSMLAIALLLSVVALTGLATSLPFVYFGLADGVIKMLFGIYLLFLSKPTLIRT